MAIQVHFAILHCFASEESTDEAVVQWNGNQIWAGEMKGGRERNLDSFQLLNGDSGIVSLIDVDSPDEDDHLGAHVIRKDELGQGWHQARFMSDEANYTLDYEVFQG